MPSASAIQAMVEAVPIVMQCPLERCMQVSASRKSSALIRPARTSSEKRQTSVPDPMDWPWKRPDSIGPPVTIMAGRSTLAAPMSMAGVVLSQPDNSTTPSKGLARTDSSTSIAIKLRKSIAVGRRSVSPRLMVGNSSGKPPACQTPLFTASATRRKWELHGVSSE